MPFNSISLPGITAWGTKTKTVQSADRVVDLDCVSEKFGIPDVDDPDPFGVHALERAGLEIKEAGSQSRPTSDTFEFKPSPSSPIFRHSFQSLNNLSRHCSVGRESVLRDPRRDSKKSMVSIDQGTQTANLPSSPSSPIDTSHKANLSTPLQSSFDATSTLKEESKAELRDLVGVETNASASVEKNSTRDSLEDVVDLEKSFVQMAPAKAQSMQETYEKTYETSSPEIDGNDDRKLGREPDMIVDGAIVEGKKNHISTEQTGEPGDDTVWSDSDTDDEGTESEDEDSLTVIEEVGPAVQVIAHKVTSPAVARAKIVNIPRRLPPAIPSRNPLRHRKRRASLGTSADRLDTTFHDDSSSTYSYSPAPSNFENSEDLYSNAWSDQTSLPEAESELGRNIDFSDPLEPSNHITQESHFSVQGTANSQPNCVAKAATVSKTSNDETITTNTQLHVFPKDTCTQDNMSMINESDDISNLMHVAEKSLRHTPFIGDLIRAGLDDSDEDEPTSRIVLPSEPYSNGATTSFADDETDRPCQMQLQVENSTPDFASRDSPATGSISSEDGQNSRMHSSATTEHDIYPSSVSDYEDSAVFKDSESFHSLPTADSESPSHV